MQEKAVKEQFPDYAEIQRYSEEGAEAEEPVSPTTVEELVGQLRGYGLEGRDVMVHSSYKSIRPVEHGPSGVVEAFLQAVGADGRLLFPTYDFHQWSETHYWDRQESPSRMGAITEAARLDPRFRRTRHPMLSYALHAKHAAAYDEDLVNSHGPKSIFERFTANNGLFVSIGALSSSNPGFSVYGDNVGWTAIHSYEIQAEAPYRRYKFFGGVYVDRGHADIRSYCACVRTGEYRTAVSPAMQEMERDGVNRLVMLGRAPIHIANAVDVEEWVMRECIRRPELFRARV